MDSSNVAKLDPNSLKVDVLYDLIFENSKSTLVFYSGRPGEPPEFCLAISQLDQKNSKNSR